ncbi:Protein kinase-like protein [Cladophialophora carrionii]|uniref:Protein kinase-like protein n=1 Tax=Cladophialophora carrionii TaxID=86049 RepID=A0A1C1CKK3_9EURO|nr:Protein kinase-like protein [Cladophialophora carrionii]
MSLNIVKPWTFKRLYAAGKCEDVGFIEMEWMEGDTLENVWNELTNEEKLSYARQLREVILDLWIKAGYRSPSQSEPGRPISDRGSLQRILAEQHHIHHSDHLSESAGSLFTATDHKIVFTHGDLSPINIIVREGRVVGIVDWEYAGWYPEHWEFVQFFRAMYADYRNFADVIFDKIYSTELVTDHLLGLLTRH